jgi:hypothetical protein
MPKIACSVPSGNGGPIGVPRTRCVPGVTIGVFEYDHWPVEGGVDPTEALDENDSYNALKAGGALVFTGATGTNVNDLRVVLISGEARR